MPVSLLSYDASSPEDVIVGALQREGGILSYPELVSVTKFPYDLLSQVVDRLAKEKRVQITDGDSAIREVRLARKVSGFVRLLSGDE